MPSVPYALVLCSLNGGANNSGGLTAAGSQTVQLSGSNTAGWTSALWQMTDYPAGFTAPAGWSTDSGGIIFYAGITPPIFTLPAIATRWGKWMFKLTVNGGVDEFGVFNPSKMVDSATAVKTLSTKGQITVGAGESTQFGGALKGWAGEGQAEAVAIEAQLGGGGGSTPTGIGWHHNTVASVMDAAAVTMGDSAIVGGAFNIKGATIPENTSRPSFKQSQATTSSATGQAMEFRSQAAKTGSNAAGGDMSFIFGKDDGTAIGTSQRNFWWGQETSVGGSEVGPTNYKSAMRLALLPGGVAAIGGADGTDFLGGGMASFSIGSYVQIGIASHSNNMYIAQIAGPYTAFFYIKNNVTNSIEEAAGDLIYTTNHATGGDDTGLRILKTDVSSPGVSRYVDIQLGGSRKFEIRKTAGLDGIDLIGQGYFYIKAPNNQLTLSSSVQIVDDAPITRILYAGTGGIRIDNSTPSTPKLHAESTNTAFEIGYEDTVANSATGKTTTVVGQNATGTTTTGGDLDVGGGTGTTANGKLNFKSAITGTSVGAAGAASAMPTPLGYLNIKVNGAAVRIAYFN